MMDATTPIRADGAAEDAGRAEARALLAELRRAGIRVVVELATLRMTVNAPHGALTRERWGELTRLSDDARAEVLAEVADVATMAARAGLPVDIRATYYPAPTRDDERETAA
jgi:hypothetical protein